ncbi:MAG TPA: DEAD/DEAH box helicase [Candidatus Wunengus sp. YC61]|uniref:DEAD/DEAH box helicase n=1 Tax=Candidatus Wunengus sp. YC61 TaxID=3367698 RepID=UPI00402A24A8
MNRIAQSIKNRLSLRPPQADSLNILAELTDKLTLKKHTPNPLSRGEYKSPLSGGDSGVGSFLQQELEKVKTSFPTCVDFERNFPSICFSLATGVGKTRLMGAFVVYLYLTKGIKNFFVLAPNITIYNKLIEDFSNSTSPKYVFQSIGEFVHRQPRIITGDTYNTISQTTFFRSEVHINVFNISKINAETKGGKLPRIKRLSEYLGDSYFNYLSSLDDLVLLMDESHHYRADRGMQVINELNPILGLELTATPKVERSGGAIKFKNVVFEYSLAKAIQDGFVKEPAVATRKDFDPSQYSTDELDRIKLEDGIRIHEDTKVALDIYARDNKVKLVKPFVLVVAQDTTHAGKLKHLIISNAFFEGNYADKVMEIHSNQSGEEKEENIEKLISLENPENKIEIVIHVNMLKEGWDVTNLYTIIPLRTATSTTLREQTLGRGLRLPYGKRTGVDKVDKLTIVAHDKFQEIIDAANQPDSIIKRQNIIEIDPQEISQQKEVVTSISNIEQKFEEEQKKIELIVEPEQRQKAQIHLELRKTILSTLPELNNAVTNVNELTKTEIKQIALEKIKQKIYSSPQKGLFAAEMMKEAEAAYETMVNDFVQNIIEIPRISILQSNEVRSGFKDFDLDTKNLNYQPVSEEILIKKLREQENDVDIVIGKGRIVFDFPEKIIVNELINYPEIDYDDQSDLLFKLVGQAIGKFRIYLDEDKLMNVVQYHKKEIGSYIYSQMMQHFYFEAPSYEKPMVKPFTRIEEHNFSKYTKDSIHHFTETITPTNTIPNKVFSSFRKAYHNLYKFDSKTEKDFVVILEQDRAVLKWLRPASNQFHIYWKHNSRQYNPDFVVETKDAIYLIETKKEMDIESADVQEKAQAALEYCKHATDFTIPNGGKPWKYVLIPHNAVMVNMSFETLARSYESQNS